MPSEDGSRHTTVASFGTVGPPTGTFYIQPYLTTATIPQKRKPDAQDPTSESIDCICGFTHDDGSLSIACDDCERWCHAACFNIVEGEVPEEWKCWECSPRDVDKEQAVRIQRERQRQIRGVMRRTSPGVEKKPRRASAAAIEGSKRRRRPSILTAQAHANTQAQRTAEDEHVEICDPWTLSYVPITKDVVPHRQTQEKLERAAHNWRGVTVISEQDLHPPRTTIQPIPASSFSHPTLSLCTNPSVRPPSYAVHTAEPVPYSSMITPYHSTIIPSSAYLSDTLNAYAHLGMPKPFVHLIGPPLDLALDSRITGDTSRFLRSGCKPNAVLRPMICPKSSMKKKDLDGVVEQQQDTLEFGVFALRDLKANEEVVLGWEWDDGHAVHNLPALIESPHSFQTPYVQHLRNQMTSMLNSFSSTFTTCACGAKAKDCALNLMAAFVDGDLPPKPFVDNIDLGPLVGSSRGFKTRERVPFSGGMTGVEMVPDPMFGNNQFSDANRDTQRRVNGHHTPVRRTISVPEMGSSPKPSPDGRNMGRRGKKRVTIVEDWAAEVDDSSSESSSEQPKQQARRRRVTTGSVSVFTDFGGVEEEKMPPKMRKRWIHQNSEARRTVQSPKRVHDEGATDDEAMEVYSDSSKMPPPPPPLHRPPTTGSTTPSSAFSSSVSPSGKDSDFTISSPAQDISPSTHFANLSLLSPVVDQTNSFSLNESFSFGTANQQIASKLSHSLSIRNANMDLNSAICLAQPSSPFADNKREGLAPSAEVSTSPSPVHLLSPIDGTLSLAESNTIGPQPSHDSTQMLIFLPPSAGDKIEGESSGGSHALEPPPSQSPTRSQSPSAPSSDRIQSPMSTPVPPPDPPPNANVESSPAPSKVKTSFKDFLMRKKRQQEEHVEPVGSTDMNDSQSKLSHTGMPNGDINSESNTGDGDGGEVDGGNGTGERYPPPDSPNLKSYRSPPHNVDVVEDPRIRHSKSASLENTAESDDTSKLSDTWIWDSKLATFGLVVQIKEDWGKRNKAGVQGLVKSVVRRVGYSPYVIMKAFHGSSHDAVPAQFVVPVPPSQVGDIVTIVAGMLKGEVGCVTEIAERKILVRLESSESIVEVEKGSICRCATKAEKSQVFRVSQTTVPEEDGEIAQPLRPFSGVRQPYATPNTPTQPRSFLGPPPSSSPSSSKQSPRLSPVLPPSNWSRQASPPNPAPSRPPSGPKALRAGVPKTYTPPHPPYPPKRSFGANPNGGMSHVPLPKGPSADREREREWTGSSWSSSRSRPPPSNGGWR